MALTVASCDRALLTDSEAEQATEPAPPEKETTLEGDVEHANPLSFRLDIEEGPRNDDDVLVLTNKGTRVPADGTEVRVKGMLREVGIDDFEPIYGRPWGPHADHFVGSRVLVLRAESIELTEPSELMKEEQRR